MDDEEAEQEFENDDDGEFALNPLFKSAELAIDVGHHLLDHGISIQLVANSLCFADCLASRISFQLSELLLQQVVMLQRLSFKMLFKLEGSQHLSTTIFGVFARNQSIWAFGFQMQEQFGLSHQFSRAIIRAQHDFEKANFQMILHIFHGHSGFASGVDTFNSSLICVRASSREMSFEIRGSEDGDTERSVETGTRGVIRAFE